MVALIKLKDKKKLFNFYLVIKLVYYIYFNQFIIMD